MPWATYDGSFVGCGTIETHRSHRRSNWIGFALFWNLLSFMILAVLRDSQGRPELNCGPRAFFSTKTVGPTVRKTTIPTCISLPASLACRRPAERSDSRHRWAERAVDGRSPNPKAAARRSPWVSAAPVLRVENGGRRVMAAPVTASAVSYTHLTLPTKA